MIDTIGLSTKNSFIDNYRTPHSEKKHVIERYTVSDDGRMLEAAVTVDDPETFNEPLHMVKRWRKVNNPMLETVCMPRTTAIASARTCSRSRRPMSPISDP